MFKPNGEYFSNSKKTTNVVIGLFHESGHQKLHMNINVGARLSPILYIKKNFEIGNQGDRTAKIKVRGEAGKCVDNYLYGYGFNTSFLFLSELSPIIMDKSLFLGKLDRLNNIAGEIALDFSNRVVANHELLNQNQNQINHMENNININRKRKFDYEYIMIDGKEFPCGIDVDNDSISA